MQQTKQETRSRTNTIVDIDEVTDLKKKKQYLDQQKAEIYELDD